MTGLISQGVHFKISIIELYKIGLIIFFWGKIFFNLEGVRKNKIRKNIQLF